MLSPRKRFISALTLSLIVRLSVAANFDSAASATNALGVDLYRQLAKGQGNVCLSPYSISCALAMTLSGADGETRAEMARVLHLGMNDDGNESFSALQKALTESAKRGEITFTIANRLFPQIGFELRSDFLARLKESYDAPPEPLDFRGNAETATKHINDWVTQQTGAKIQNLIPAPLDATTRLVLANALYVKAAWANVFPEETTKREAFYVNGSAAVDVPTMRGVRKIGYKKFDDYTALTLSYAGGEFQFLIFLPNERNGLSRLEERLTSERLTKGVGPDIAEIDLHLPKFKFEPPSIQLADQLQALGMKTAFDIPRGSANFDRMTPSKSNDYLAISNVFHKTFIAVDEKGTEAAATTALPVTVYSAVLRPPKPIKVKVDRPFIYAIQYVPKSVCLFLGRVTDPR